MHSTSDRQQVSAVPAQSYRKTPTGWVLALDHAIVYPTMHCMLSHNSGHKTAPMADTCEMIAGFNDNQTNSASDSSLRNAIQDYPILYDKSQ